MWLPWLPYCWMLVTGIALADEWITDGRTGKQYTFLKPNFRNYDIGHKLSQEACQKVGGFLPEPKNKEENDFIGNLGKYAVRLGMTDKVREGDWRWDRDNAMVEWLNWWDGEPGGADGMDCGVMAGRLWAAAGVRHRDPSGWMEKSCTDIRVYFDRILCEKMCPDKLLDIFIFMDGSDVVKDYFQKQIDFVSNLVKLFKLGATRIGVHHFGKFGKNVVYRAAGFNMDRYKNTKDLLDCVQRFEPYGGATPINYILRYAREYYFNPSTQYGARENASDDSHWWPLEQSPGYKETSGAPSHDQHHHSGGSRRGGRGQAGGRADRVPRRQERPRAGRACSSR